MNGAVKVGPGRAGVNTFSIEVHRRLGYDVRLTRGLFEPSRGELADALRGGEAPAVIIDRTVDRLHGDRIRAYLRAHGLHADARWCSHPVEGDKDLHGLVRLLELLDAARVGRRSPLLLIGGGTLLDVGSLAAGLYRRGVPHVRVPTTLVGMVDAGIGIKSAVNFGGHKNRIGTFYPPAAVFDDVDFLATLPRRELRQGIAEIAKMGIIAEPRIAELLRDVGPSLLAQPFPWDERVEELLALAIESMLRCLAPNLFEDQSLQRLVDFGHAFSPWLEMRSGDRVPHGEAVAVDMALTTRLARLLDLCPGPVEADVLALLEHLDLPLHHPCLDDVDGLCAALEETSRHRGGDIHLPFPEALGVGRFLTWEMVGSRERLREALASAASSLGQRQSRSDAVRRRRPAVGKRPSWELL